MFFDTTLRRCVFLLKKEFPMIASLGNGEMGISPIE